MRKLFVLSVAIVFLAVLTGSAPAANPYPSMYTLDNIYYYLAEGTAATWGDHSLEPQSSAPGQDISGFTKSLEDIYYYMFDSFGHQSIATYDMIAPNVDEGYYFFCTDTNTNYWGLQEGIKPSTTPIPPPSAGGDWVLVPGDAGIGTDDFYVMKYEAKNVGGAFSRSTDTPYVNINLANSQAACEALGTGYHLLTVDEAQTINRNLEQVASNWTGGVVGTGVLKRGNVGDTATGDYNGADPEFGTGRNELAKLTLDNGNEIWDWSGNVSEWIYGKGASGTIGTSSDPGNIDWRTTSGWVEWDLADLNEERSVLGPSDGSWTATQGMGRFYGGPATNAFVRGGHWGNEAHAGVFGLSLNDAPSVTSAAVGFRCCK